jgi:hypothetical protein
MRVTRIVEDIDLAVAAEAKDRGYSRQLGKIMAKRGRGRKGDTRFIIQSLRFLVEGYYAIDVIPLCMEIVKAALITDNEKDEETDGDAGCKAADIDQRIFLVTAEAAEGNAEVVAEHILVI